MSCFPLTLHTKDGSNSIDRNEFCQGDLDFDGGRKNGGDDYSEIIGDARGVGKHDAIVVGYHVFFFGT